MKTKKNLIDFEKASEILEPIIALNKTFLKHIKTLRY